ncbi:hypothetical protein O2W16_14645 [Modestobacter sp. VKM Ac-2984]|nr:hypothetical protein [Modestobacter sp. VKM Ac-2984]
MAAAVLRRWYVFLLVAGLAAVVAVGSYRDARPVYTSTTVMTVLPSQDLVRVRGEVNAGESSLGNPFGISANTVLAALLADQINTGGIVLPPEAGDATLAVSASGQDLRQFFTVQAVASTSAGAIAALTAAAEQSPQVLAAIQVAAGSPTDQLYTAQQTRLPTAPLAEYPDRSRLVLGTMLAGLLLATLLSVVVDSVVLARRRRSTKRKTAPLPSRTTPLDGPDAGSDDEPGSDGYGRHHPLESVLPSYAEVPARDQPEPPDAGGGTRTL